MKTVFPIVCVLLLTAGWRPLTAQAGTDVRNPKPVSADNTYDPNIKSAALWDGREYTDFHAANNPKMVAASDAWYIHPDEYVLGVTVNGESRAYPTRFLAWHHIVNDCAGKPDQGGRTFFTITFCVVCNTGIRFDPVVNGTPLKFDFFGLYNGVMTMFDTQTKSVWQQVGGKAIRGKMIGATLKTGPVLDTTWRHWRELHPDTCVMAPDPAARKNYDPNGSIIDRGFDRFPTQYFRKSLTHRDNRLPAHDMVLAVCVSDSRRDVRQIDFPKEQKPARSQSRVYPLKYLRIASSVVNDTLGRQSIAVFYEADSATCCAVSRELDGRMLTFERRKDARGKPAFFDKETGSRWTVEGVALDGLQRGKRLSRLDSTLSEWYGWVAYFPQTTVYSAKLVPAVQVRN